MILILRGHYVCKGPCQRIDLEKEYEGFHLARDGVKVFFWDKYFLLLQEKNSSTLLCTLKINPMINKGYERFNFQLRPFLRVYFIVSVLLHELFSSQQIFGFLKKRGIKTILMGIFLFLFYDISFWLKNSIIIFVEHFKFNDSYFYGVDLFSKFILSLYRFFLFGVFWRKLRRPSEDFWGKFEVVSKKNISNPFLEKESKSFHRIDLNDQFFSLWISFFLLFQLIFFSIRPVELNSFYLFYFWIHMIKIFFLIASFFLTFELVLRRNQWSKFKKDENFFAQNIFPEEFFLRIKKGLSKQESLNINEFANELKGFCRNPGIIEYNDGKKIRVSFTIGGVNVS